MFAQLFPWLFPASSVVDGNPFASYAMDVWQRNILFLDAMRQRGNQYNAHASAPVQHVLNFDFELLLEGRDLPRPVNYGLVRILAPEGVETDVTKRPFVVIDPRAGHGPGIGGFKPDSQIGAVLRAGHPCYFIGFLHEPIDGQTIEDVGWAELAFVEHVAGLHPDADGKPCLIGNCQAGWAIMMLAATAPESVGPLLVVGSPLSYWAGVRGTNPMRYLGGLLGGTWMTALAGDLGDGIFDGAHLVGNFENLNPGNSLWGKNYNLWSQIDTEVPRYLEFERWWGGHVLLTAEEMQFIADELFVGNRLVQGGISTSDGVQIDLRNIRSPIVVFCSQGDNITPPQQALRWILDLYDTDEDIVAHGQTIVYAVHDNIGHLGIFVSGKVGRKESDQFTRNMDLIDALPPGLYEAVFNDKGPDDANPDLAYGDYIARFESRTLDDIRAFGDAGSEDDAAFEAVARVSEIGQSLYRTLVSPYLQPWVSEASAAWMRENHPARLQYRMFSDENPFMAGVAAMADAVREGRKPVTGENGFKTLERQASDGIVMALDSYRDVRDNLIEQLFFGVYGSDAVQAALGLRSASVERRLDQQAGDAPSKLALRRQLIAAAKERMTSGGEREAGIRALLYIGLAEGTADERGFSALIRLRDLLPKERALSLVELKALVREQFLMLLLDEAAAIEAIPGMLPAELAGRQELFEHIVSVVKAPGEPEDERLARLQQMAEMFGVSDAETAPRDGTDAGPGTANASTLEPKVPTRRKAPSTRRTRTADRGGKKTA